MPSKDSGSSKKDDEIVFDVPEFNPDWVRFDDTVILLGPRKGGKTVGAREILLSKNKPPRGMFQVGSPEGLKTWTDSLPLAFLHESDEIDEAFFKKWMDEQKAVVTKVEVECKKRYTKWMANSNKKIDAAKKEEVAALQARANAEEWSAEKLARKLAKIRAKYDELTLQESKRLWKRKEELYDRMVLPESCFCGFDDLGEEKKGVMDHKVMKTLVNTGRHYGALVIVIAQYAKHLSSACRSGMNWLFLWTGSLSIGDSKKVFEDYFPATMFSSRKSVMRIFKAITDADPQNCMVVWRSNPNSKKAQDCVFHWNPIKSLALRRGNVPMFGDATFKLHSDLFYNGPYSYIQNIPDRKQSSKRNTKLPTTTTATVTLAAESKPSEEERQKAIDQFLSATPVPVPETKTEKLDKMAQKQAINRWKKADQLKKRSSHLTSFAATTTNANAGTSMPGTMTVPTQLSTPVAPLPTVP